MMHMQTVISSNNENFKSNHKLGPFRTNRLFLILILLILSILPNNIGLYTRNALEDAYIGVSVFVAVTLAFFYFAEKISGIDLSLIHI